MQTNLKRELKDRVDHYYRWLLRSMSTLVDDPAVQIGITLTAEPTISIARSDYVRRVALFQTCAFAKDSFIFVQAMGGFKEFGACLANDDQARIKVSFLDGVKPHSKTRIVVSMLPDESDQMVAIEMNTEDDSLCLLTLMLW